MPERYPAPLHPSRIPYSPFLLQGRAKISRAPLTTGRATDQPFSSNFESRNGGAPIEIVNGDAGSQMSIRRLPRGIMKQVDTKPAATLVRRVWVTLTAVLVAVCLFFDP